ncbi:Zinc-binding domain of primase-helicase [Caballeronia temeraria]|uniref:Zinc-binding domain of primase-helicase n=2 Tax=Caballeronia TaxID=1827195 RepID=A0A158D6Q6_9BURK|nr:MULTISPECIES: primase-helicase zinc-binding domain-containing protein [Caballeronia]SAK57549.1 Zinc-binding domain of primase-helicase [Caballeronia temeraria]SAK90342.1 Zinc-binding domain of primase-helicase [Caballeronia catudaia]
MNAKRLKLSPEQWVTLLHKYGVPESSLTGKSGSCPICGGNDRFTYDNKRGRGDWVCRKCNNGDPKAGDGFELICKVAGMSFRELMLELEGGSLAEARQCRAQQAAAPAPGRKVDPEWARKRLESMWDRATLIGSDGLVPRYLRARVPGLTAPPSQALRQAMLDYRHEKKVIGQWPGIIARFTLPDGRLGTLHRTFLERSTVAKATIVTNDGEILPAKLNDVTLHKLNGGAVRLMDPVDGEIGVAEGLETAYAAHMQFGVPTWYCLNRILLADFVVPDGLGIRVVHIFADFDAIDPRTGKSPGVDAALKLAKRLRAEGYTAVIHRPKKRETDFADEWLVCRGMKRAASKLPVRNLQREAAHV